jgi:hypothetical protein
LTRHVQGVIHGKTIELDQDLGMADGQRVSIEVQVDLPASPWGEGIRRSAGIAADVPGFDEAFEQVQRDRELATSRDIDE